MKQGDPVKIEILFQGAILVEHAYIYEYSENVVAMALQLKSKRVDILSTGTDGIFPVIDLEPIEGVTLYTDKSKKNEPTSVVIAQFKGYSIWSCTSSKYTVYICLTKDNL